LFPLPYNFSLFENETQYRAFLYSSKYLHLKKAIFAEKRHLAIGTQLALIIIRRKKTTT